jgi:hypothetical protein
MLNNIWNWIVGDFGKSAGKQEYRNAPASRKLIQWMYSLGSMVLMLIRLAALSLLLYGIIRLFSLPVEVWLPYLRESALT